MRRLHLDQETRLCQDLINFLCEQTRFVLS